MFGLACLVWPESRVDLYCVVWKKEKNLVSKKCETEFKTFAFACHSLVQYENKRFSQTNSFSPMQTKNASRLF